MKIKRTQWKKNWEEFEFYFVLDFKEKKEPRPKVGGPNQKPLTIKPYPMKILREYITPM